MTEALWLIARFYMENRRGYGLTTHLAPLQSDAAALLSAALPAGTDVSAMDDDAIASAFNSGSETITEKG